MYIYIDGSNTRILLHIKEPICKRNIMDKWTTLFVFNFKELDNAKGDK